MAEYKTKLQDNPRGVLEPYITNLLSESKQARKQALQGINAEIFESPLNQDCDLTVVFPEIYAFVLKSLSDNAEACREVAVVIVSNFIERLPLNDYYLTYILPVIVRRIGSPEIVEESEELRLLLINLVHKIIEKYKDSQQLLSPFINDFTSILAKTATDPFPKVKLEACECIILLSQELKRDFHTQSDSYVKPVLSNFAHQHFRVRVASIKAIGAIVLSGSAKCFELSITPMAEKLFDENTQVRLQVTLEVGNWMLNLRDRYSFWHRMIPLLLTSMSDVIADVRETASKLWDDIGLQYMDENEEDLKKKTDFLTDVPKHYPDVKRPNLGCRTLVHTNVGKIVPAIAREMDGWHADARLRVSQLLCWLILSAEEGSTQHANTIVRTMHRGATDDDERVVVEIKRAAELFGYFITPSTWWPLLEAEVDSWGALLVIANIIKGSQAELIKEKVMTELCNEMSDPDRCQTRKVKYQANMLRVAEAIMDLCRDDCKPVAKQLFTICFTAYAMPADDTIHFMALCSAMGEQLHLIAPLLKECLATPKVDPEVKLKMFTTLSTVLLKRQDNFRKCDSTKLEAFLKIVIEEVIMSNLVWSPGRTAEAIRTAAVACLCSALQQDPANETPQFKEHCGDGDKVDVEVNLFPTKESLEPFLDEMTPLLVGLADDNSALTRQHTLRAVSYLATLAKQRGCFTAELLHKLYFAVLKRLDDSSDKVRSFAVQTVCVLFKNRPEPYDIIVFNAHIDATYNAMLVHLDDTDEVFRKEMLDALLSIAEVDPKLLQKKIKANVHLYRNKVAYERLSNHIEKLKI